MTFSIAAGSAVARCAIVAAAFTLVATPLFAITIDGESRLTEEQFAKKHAKPLNEVKKAFAATGKIECPQTYGTAALAKQNDVVITVAHLFVDAKTCKLKQSPEQCQFVTDDGESIVKRSMQLVAMGN